MSGANGVPAHLLPRWEYRDAVLSEECALSATAKLVLVIIDGFRSSRSPIPFPSQETIGQRANLTRRTVREALKEAVARGWIQRHTRLGSDGQRLSDAYDLVVPDWFRQLPPPGEEFTHPPGKCFPTPGEGIAHESDKQANSPTTEAPQIGASTGKPSFKIEPYATVWREKVGAPAYARLTKALRPVEKLEGPAAALGAFTAFCDSEDRRFGPEFFAQRYKNYLPKTIQVYTPTGGPTPEFLALLESIR